MTVKELQTINDVQNQLIDAQQKHVEGLKDVIFRQKELIEALKMRVSLLETHNDLLLKKIGNR